MKTLHVIKVREIYAEDILDGGKPFEIRKNDRNYRVGDKILFRVIDSKTLERVQHALNKRLFDVTYVLEDVPGLHKGYAIIGIRQCAD